MPDMSPLDDDDSIRDLSVTSSLGRRGAKSAIDEAWQPADLLPDLPAKTTVARARRIFGLGTVLALLGLSVCLLIVALGAGYLAYSANTDRDTAEHTFNGMIAQANADKRTLAETLTDPDAVYLHLTQTGKTSGTKADISLVLSRGQRGVPYILAARNLPALVGGRTYQLWIAQADGAVGTETTPVLVTSGPFTPDAGGGVLQGFGGINDLSPYRTIFLTEEGPGGSNTPTGAHLFEGQISQAIPLRVTGS